MLAFFRLNDPYRLLVIFFLMLILRLPTFFSADMLTIPELNFMLVGEKMSEGNQLYSEIWDSLAPLSAMVYASIDYLFGRSQLAYQIIAFFNACFQIFIFITFLLRSRAFAENTYVPAFILSLLLSFSYDMHTLSPLSMGLTFVMLAMRNIFGHIDVRAKRDEKILNIGLYLGLATMFYVPYSLYSICTLLIFMMFTGTIYRRYLLMLFGFLLPIIVGGAYYYVSGNFVDFIYSFTAPLFVLKKISFLSFKSLALLFSVPLAYFGLSLLTVFGKARLTNYQIRLAQTMMVWILFSLFFVLITEWNAPVIFIVFMPPIAFFITHYFLFKRRGIITEISFFIFVSLIVSCELFSIYHNNRLENYYADQTYLVGKEENQLFDGKTILVLDDNVRPYKNARHATPFLNWRLCKEVFNNTEYFDNIALLYNGFVNDMPQVIVDPNGLMNDIFNAIPTLKNNYTKVGNNYYLIGKNKVSN